MRLGEPDEEARVAQGNHPLCECGSGRCRCGMLNTYNLRGSTGGSTDSKPTRVGAEQSGNAHESRLRRRLVQRPWKPGAVQEPRCRFGGHKLARGCENEDCPPEIW